MYQNSILHYKNKQQIKILKNYQMCVLETISETIKRNHTKQNKYIIKGMIYEKYSRYLRKLFKYQHSPWLITKIVLAKKNSSSNEIIIE